MKSSNKNYKITHARYFGCYSRAAVAASPLRAACAVLIFIFTILRPSQTAIEKDEKRDFTEGNHQYRQTPNAI